MPPDDRHSAVELERYNYDVHVLPSLSLLQVGPPLLAKDRECQVPTEARCEDVVLVASPDIRGKKVGRARTGFHHYCNPRAPERTLGFQSPTIFFSTSLYRQAPL